MKNFKSKTIIGIVLLIIITVAISGCVSSGEKTKQNETRNNEQPITQQKYYININREGTGAGDVRVVSSGVYYTCTNICPMPFQQGTAVTLETRTYVNNKFVSWGGDCSGAGTAPTCTLTMDSDKTVTVNFALMQSGVRTVG